MKKSRKLIVIALGLAILGGGISGHALAALTLPGNHAETKQQGNYKEVYTCTFKFESTMRTETVEASQPSSVEIAEALIETWYQGSSDIKCVRTA